MAEIKTGWLKDYNGEKFAPITDARQVYFNGTKDENVQEVLSKKPGRLVENEVFNGMAAGQGAEIFNDLKNNIAIGEFSHVEGQYNVAKGNYSHVEGALSYSSGNYSHAEGQGNGTAIGISNVIAGATTYTISFASGPINVGDYIISDQAEGPKKILSINNNELIVEESLSPNKDLSLLYCIVIPNRASADYSHAEGFGTQAKGTSSHAEGFNTIASGLYSHTEGRFNIEDNNNKYSHIVGNGNNDTKRSNAHTLDWDGNAWFSGDVYIKSTSGTNKDSGSKKLATEEYVNSNKSNIVIREW